MYIYVPALVFNFVVAELFFLGCCVKDYLCNSEYFEYYLLKGLCVLFFIFSKGSCRCIEVFFSLLITT